MPRREKWGWTFVAAAGLFLALAATVWLAAVPPFERQLYEAITAAVPKTPFLRRITELGAATVLVPASVFLLIIIPRQFLRHWWVWLAVMVVVAGLEGLGKAAIGRPRPVTLRPGFPSGHTAAAAAFYMMACYLAAGALKNPALRGAFYAAAALVIALVALSRVALHVHWPLDVLGGATLGIAVLAGAAWWHERHPAAARVLAPSLPPAFPDGVYRWQNIIVVTLVAVLFLSPPMAEESWLLDLMFDLSGVAGIVLGLLLRLWVAGHTEKPAFFPKRPPTRLVTSGPYAYMRHPLPLSTFLIGVGLVLLAESGPGLILVPAILIVMFRITIPREEAYLAGRFGRAYADYCARVPPWPRLTMSVLAGGASAVFRARPARWWCIVQELPAVVGTVLLAALAEASKFVPHLFR